ncbi:30S ribosomal protein S6 [Dissulfurirhabdus thermomarina]|uniref:Small ribosomal subunit protein bS6 n=1 Tax=Dissulfurirhabdus thermomarina TaxID=1765737 RepID=A0A6N9TNK2_DISTH|nr:30S ribosomal protein S6 [Dissulfurirhabdus thermomarina]NDY42871.1 30S ribosomal protein S6 [Dissulfurirhabdus thermomarina]NMX24428.1 30S ribosomal protein S6 [Dissulfurirhabdus thermomarina]
MSLRYYETLYLLRPDLGEADRAAVGEALRGIVTSRGGQVVEEAPWPLRRLAYPVKKHTQGYYVLMEYGATPDTVAEITRVLRIDERALKFLTLQKDDTFDAEAIAREKEALAQKKAAEAPAEAAAPEAASPRQEPAPAAEPETPAEPPAPATDEPAE